MATITSVDSAIEYGKKMQMDNPWIENGIWAVSLDDAFMVKGFHEVFTHYYGNEQSVPIVHYIRGAVIDHVTNIILYRRVYESDGFTATDLEIIRKVAEACAVLNISFMDYILYTHTPRVKNPVILSARMQGISTIHYKSPQKGA
jgi:hypothetical protein